MKRTLSLVLALVMVLGTFTTVFAAADPTAADLAGKFLEEKEVLKGDDKTGDLMLEENLKRQDMVVLLSRLMGVEDVASEFPLPEEGLVWEDVEDPYYEPYLAWAKGNEYVKGIEEDKFGFDETVTAQDYALLLLRVLGYEDAVWEDALEDAKALGILENTELEDKTPVVRGTMAVMVFNALGVKVNGSEETLAEKLEIEMPVPEALEVVSVTADNLKEVKVVFNQEVDADTVVDANVKVNGLEGSVILEEDGMTAVITLKKVLVNQGKYKVVVDKVATVDGVVIEKTEIDFTAFDATLPKVEEVIVTGPRNLTLVFSEPINEEKTEGKVEVKQDKLTLGNSVKISGNKVDVQVFTNFVDGKEYTVTVKDFEDYAGYKNIINTLSFTYEKDETPPIATVEKVEQEYVVVSFNKPVKGISKDKFYHTFSAWKAVSVKDAADKEVTANDSVNEVYVYFYEKDGDKGIPAGGSVFGILGSTIKDNWGNALGNQEFNVTAVADRTAPEVESIAVRTENTVRITFSKNVKSLERKNVQVLDEAGKSISGMYLTITQIKPNVYDVKMSKNMAGKIVTVSVKDVEDTTLFGNVLSLYSELIEITDKQEPKVEKVYYNLETENDSNKNAIYVVFDEAVDAETALVASNYAIVVGREVTMLTAAPTFDALNNRVRLPLKKSEVEDLRTALEGREDVLIEDETVEVSKARLQVINVKDLAGNTIVPILNYIDGNLGLTNDVKVTVTATSKTRLVAKFDDVLSNVDIAAFKINGKQDFTLTQSDDATTTTLTFDVASKDAFATNAEGINFEISNKKNIKNSYGNEAKFYASAAEFETKPVGDKIAPEIKEVIVEGKLVTIVFTEDMAEETFSKYSFLVDGYEVDSVVDPVGNKFEITLKEYYEIANKKIAIAYNLDVTDKKDNKLNAEKGVYKEFDWKAGTSSVQSKLNELKSILEENVIGKDEDTGYYDTTARNLVNDTLASANIGLDPADFTITLKDFVDDNKEVKVSLTSDSTINVVFMLVREGAGKIVEDNKVLNKNTDVEYDTIQAAIDEATAGDTILVGEGEFKEEIRINKSIKLIGSGIGKTILNPRDVNSAKIIYLGDASTYGNDLSGTVVEYFTINSPIKSEKDIASIYLTGKGTEGNEIVVRNNEFLEGEENEQHLPILTPYSEDIKHIKIENNIIKNGKYGMYFNSISNVMINGNKIENTRFSGITFAGKEDMKVDDIIIAGNQFINIATEDTAYHLSYHSGLGFQNYGDNITIEDNNFEMANGHQELYPEALN